MRETRLIGLDDAPTLVELLRANRDFMAPWEPLRGEDFFTVDRQRDIIRTDLAEHERGAKQPHVIIDESGRIVGRITLNGIVRCAFQSCSVGYWVSAADNGRGFATAAVRDIVRVAFEDLGLHRVQAEILLHNVGSRRVLERNGFVQFGMAPTYLKIAGEWQDMAIYQAVNTKHS